MPPTWNWKQFATAGILFGKNWLFIGELKSSKELANTAKMPKKTSS
jgi:hypothetical protein